MATAREIIDNAVSDNGIIAAGQNPSVSEYDFALKKLNNIQRALFGDVIGPTLVAKPATVSRRVENGEMIMAGSVAITLTLHPTPKAGDRFGVADRGSFATNPATVNPNGYMLEATTANRVLNVNGLGGQWFFRDDKGNWELERDWGLDDVIYFDAPLERPLTAMLAVALAPSFGESVTLSKVTVLQADEGRELFMRRYGRKGRVESPPRKKADP